MATLITEQTLDAVLAELTNAQGYAAILPPSAYYDINGDLLCRFDEVEIVRGDLKGMHADFLGGGYGDGSGMAWLDVWELGQISIRSCDVALANFA